MSLNATTSEDVRVSFAVLIATDSILCLTLFLGLLANVLTILTIAKNKHLRSPMNINLISLSIVDLFTCIFVIPVRLGINNSPLTPKALDVTCKALVFMKSFSDYAEPCILVAISFERYQAVAKPFESKNKKKRIILITMVTALFSVLFASLSAAWLHDGGTLFPCYKSYEDGDLLLFRETYVTLPIGVSCISFILVFYILMIRTLREHSKSIFGKTNPFKNKLQFWRRKRSKRNKTQPMDDADQAPSTSTVDKHHITNTGIQPNSGTIIADDLTRVPESKVKTDHWKTLKNTNFQSTAQTIRKISVLVTRDNILSKKRHVPQTFLRNSLDNTILKNNDPTSKNINECSQQTNRSNCGDQNTKVSFKASHTHDYANSRQNSINDKTNAPLEGQNIDSLSNERNMEPVCKETGLIGNRVSQCEQSEVKNINKAKVSNVAENGELEENKHTINDRNKDNDSKILTGMKNVPSDNPIRPKNKNLSENQNLGKIHRSTSVSQQPTPELDRNKDNLFESSVNSIKGNVNSTQDLNWPKENDMGRKNQYGANQHETDENDSVIPYVINTSDNQTVISSINGKLNTCDEVKQDQCANSHDSQTNVSEIMHYPNSTQTGTFKKDQISLLENSTENMNASNSNATSTGDQKLFVQNSSTDQNNIDTKKASIDIQAKDTQDMPTSDTVRNIDVVDFDGTVHKDVVVKGPVCGAVCVMNPSNKVAGRRKVEMRAAKRIAIVIGSFTVVWCLLPVTSLIVCVRGDIAISDIGTLLLTSSLSCCTVVFNPVLNFVMNKQLRSSAVAMIKRTGACIRQKF